MPAVCNLKVEIGKRVSRNDAFSNGDPGQLTLASMLESRSMTRWFLLPRHRLGKGREAAADPAFLNGDRHRVEFFSKNFRKLGSARR
jgi:hypothetical protein